MTRITLTTDKADVTPDVTEFLEIYKYLFCCFNCFVVNIVI